ncbi:redoxin domain-containing protein [uncultured Hyphomicrobium sp.]|uniref:redoxin domain-containing protein n=1 Tax=uncultured Hyphomicrobium sp. TaxID=194373 RepID=UPI0025FDDEF8|nr:redoxin domain-containing protein [uncultured Hyphomicrobium sp.]
MKQTTTLADAFEEICASEAPLNERLAAYAEKLRELNFPFAEAYDEVVARVLAGEVGQMAPAVGEPMPDFILPGKDGHLVSLDDVTQHGPAVISFNRGHWCSFCKIELRTIAEHHEEITASGAVMVSIIPDRQQFAGPLHALTLGKIQILTDVDNGYALSLGLVMWIGEHLKALMKGRGYHLETFHGSDGWFIPLPATFVVDQSKIVLARFVDPDFRRRMEIDEILAALRLRKDFHPG